MTLRKEGSSGRTRLLTFALLLLGVAGLGSLCPRRVAGQLAPDVTGTVVERDTRHLLVGADVELRAVESGDVVERTTTGRGGTFQFPSVPPGRYVLTVSRLGYEDAQRTLTLELGEPRSVTVPLSLEDEGIASTVRSPVRRPVQQRDVPSSVSVVRPEVILKEGASSAVEALQPTVGIHVAQTGVDRRLVSLRGPRMPFASGPHVTSTVGPPGCRFSA